MDRTRALGESLERINREIEGLLEGVEKGAYDPGRHAFNFVGKAVRSRFTLLLGDALGLQRAVSERISAAAELTHAASLMHDDCIDRAALRRGIPSLNRSMGMNAAILVGDLVISFAFDYAARISPSTPLDLIRAVRRMTEGALLEENARHKRVAPVEAERIVRLKTGELFRWCALTACHASGRPELYEACGTIGRETGVIFQLVDDVLDFEGEAGETGKDALMDLTEGRTTLPLLMALEDPRFSPKIAEELSAMRTGPAGDLAPALRISALIRENGFAAAARAKARERTRALEKEFALLPAGPASDPFKDFIRALPERMK